MYAALAANHLEIHFFFRHKKKAACHYHQLRRRRLHPKRKERKKKSSIRKRISTHTTLCEEYLHTWKECQTDRQNKQIHMHTFLGSKKDGHTYKKSLNFSVTTTSFNSFLNKSQLHILLLEMKFLFKYLLFLVIK